MYFFNDHEMETAKWYREVFSKYQELNENESADTQWQYDENTSRYFPFYSCLITFIILCCVGCTDIVGTEV